MTQLDLSLTRAFAALLAQAKPADAHQLLSTVLTDKEMELIERRLRVAKMLEAGASYSTIQKELKVSAATVAGMVEQRKSDTFATLMRKLEKELARYAWFASRT